MRFLRNVCPLVIFVSTMLLAQSNPVPLINNPLVPDASAPGSSSFTLTVNGTGFVSASTVNWNGRPLATTFIGSSQLTATVPAGDVATASTASVTVMNPAPGGGISNVDYFDIRTPYSQVSFGQSTLNTGNFPYQLIAADVNNDGNLDLIVCEFSDSAVSVSLGNGDGTFQPAVEYAVAGNPFAVVAEDFNHDGNPDLAVANLSLDGSTGYLSVLLANGGGTFQPHQDLDMGVIPEALTVGDFNADGNLDIAVALNPAGAQAEVTILLGNGDGTFQAPVDYNPGNGAGGVTSGDFNRDGKLDLAVVSGAGVSILLGNGDGTFQSAVNYPTAFNPYSVITGDFNNDGKLDLAVGAVGGTHGYVSILLGNGDGTFQNSINYSVPDIVFNIAAGDFNGDGVLDLSTVGFGGAAYVWLGKGDGKFGTPGYFVAAPESVSLAVGDFNHDGMLDVATADERSNSVSVLLQGTAVLSNTIVNFGRVKVGKMSKPVDVKFTNIGSATVTISGITVTGTYAQDFKEKSNCHSTLAAGGSCIISAFFKPLQANQNMTATVSIVDSAVPGSQSILLEGTSP
jgi:hypothetical protein